MWALVAVAAATRLGIAQAQEAPRAEQLFYERLRALHTQAYEQARTLFEQSLVIAARGSVLLDLAKAEWALGRHVDALKHLRAALERSDLPADNRQPAERGLARWNAAVGHIVVKTDAGAHLQIDGKPIDGAAPFAEPLDVEPGVRVVETRLGSLSVRAEVDAKAGVVVEVNAFVAHPVPAASMASDVSSRPAEPPPPGPAALSPAPPSSGVFWNPRRLAGASVAGAGVVSLIVGGGFFALASSDEHRATAAAAGLGPSGCSGPSRASACSAQDMAVASERTDGTISRVAIGAGIAAVVAGAVLAVWPSASTRDVAIAPVIHANGGGLAFQGTF
jgi:hypothetical protein